MGRYTSVGLPESLRVRGDVVGLLFGFLPLCLVLSAPWLGRPFAGAAGIGVQTAVASSLAGFCGCLLGSGSGQGASFGPRAGVRAGAVASVVGASLLVLAATLQAFGIGHPFPADARSPVFAALLPQAHPCQILLISLLSLPASVFFGAASSILTAIRLAPAAAPDIRSEAPPTRRGPAHAILLASLAGLLSPLALGLRPQPKPAVVSLPAAQPQPAPEPPPPWRYERPEGLAEASPSRLYVARATSFSGAASGLPAAISPDDRLFAYFARLPRPAVEVRSLERLDVAARAEITDEPASLAWSPDGRRLLIQTKGEHRRLHVIRLPGSEMLTLPQPTDADIPEGRAEWIGDEEVAFAGGGDPRVLSLDTLRSAPLNDSQIWNRLSDERREAIRVGAVPAPLPKGARWQAEIASPILRYDALAGALGIRVTEGPFCLAVADRGRACRRPLAGAALKVGDLVASTADGTRLVRMHDGFATVLFLGVRGDTPARIEADMPSPPGRALAEAVSGRRLCAFVCAPLVNPLNGKTVGPDRSRVKGLARFESWNGRKAKVWIAEEYAAASRGDVIADIHTWTEGRPRPAGGPAESGWFHAIDETEAGPAPLRSDAPPLDRGQSAVASAAGLIEIAGPVASRGRAASKEPAPSLTLPIPADRGDSPPQTDPRLRPFILDHHAKSSRGDVAGVVADYAERVDYFDNGLIDREFILKDESRYHAPGTRVTETVVREPTFRRLEGGAYDASYSVSFVREQAGGRKARGVSEVELRIAAGDGGLRIIRQRATVRDEEAP